MAHARDLVKFRCRSLGACERRVREEPDRSGLAWSQFPTYNQDEFSMAFTQLCADDLQGGLSFTLGSNACRIREHSPFYKQGH